MNVEIRGEFNVFLLNEEILAAFPELIETKGEEKFSLYVLAYDLGILRFKTDVRIDEARFVAVLKAHDPKGEAKHEKEERREKELEASIEEKLVRLGFTEEEISFLWDFLDKRR